MMLRNALDQAVVSTSTGGETGWSIRFPAASNAISAGEPITSIYRVRAASASIDSEM